jgi:hypothetical protein
MWGYFSKQMILKIFVHKKFDLIMRPITEFLDFLKDNNLFSIKNQHNVYFENSDSLKLIIEKLIFSNGQIVRVNEDGILKGLISIHDIIAYFV